MAKPKNPLLSLGARGTIADSFTFQKRGRRTIARQKPIPTDRKTVLQLAQRQRYKDAVAVWNALTIEEKETWRGVCPGLTAYQCFMSSELLYVAPLPPPEEQTEEQTLHNGAYSVYTNCPRRGQHLIIPPTRLVTKLGFWLVPWGSPSGDLSFRIRAVADDSIQLEKLWGDAADLPPEITYHELEFDTPKELAADYYLLCEFPYGTTSNCVDIRIQFSDVKPDENHVRYSNTEYYDHLNYDCAYRYKYYLP